MLRKRFFLSIRKLLGFTLIEAMITLLFLSFALLGMAALMTNVTKVTSQRGKFDQAVKLSKGRLSQLGHVEFNLIATGTDQTTRLLYGSPSQQVVVEGPLNYMGLTSGASSVGPFVFTRSLVVCKDDTDGGASAAAAGGATACGNVAASRPSELSCDTSLLSQGQVQVRVMTTFIDRGGGCHKANFDQILVNFQ